MMVTAASKRSKRVKPVKKRQARTSMAKMARSRVPVEKLLPKHVASSLADVVSTAGDISPARVADLDEHLQIAKKYGVSPRRLANYLRRIAKDVTPENTESLNGSATPASDKPCDDETPSTSYPDRVRKHRTRQACVSALLDRTFGELAKSSPDLWERRAYLMLVGLVYERLATNEEELPTAELVALAKVLAENRRANSRALDTIKPPSDATEIEVTKGELPPRLGDAVRQVYGISLPGMRIDKERPTSLDGDDSTSAPVGVPHG